jgi:DNA repair protein RecO (recombination protein O)
MMQWGQLRVEENISLTAALSLNTQPSTLNSPLDTTPAILLRKIKLTETSLIVTWLTEQHGKLKTVAKGARQAKSRFAGRLDLFFECEIQFSRSRKSELHALREAELHEAYEGLRLDYSRVALASYFVELIELVTEPEHAVPELFDLLRRALRYLSEHPADRRALEHFENELARLLGIANPDVSAAIAIGRVYHHLPKGRQEVIRLLEQ